MILFQAKIQDNEISHLSFRIDGKTSAGNRELDDKQDEQNHHILLGGKKENLGLRLVSNFSS